MRVAFTKSEWLAVTVLYRSEQVDDLRRAVAILHTWRARMGNSLHVAAEMSELLLAAFIADKATHANDWLAVFNLRLLYSAAVIRFVNYVNEMCQRKRPAKIMSVREAVSMMNVPAWIVQVRHEATHAHLPPLKRLREAARWCHEWLWHNHWKKPVDEAMSAEEEKGIALPTLNDRIVALIDDFIRYRMNHPDEGLRPYRPRANGLLDQLEKMVLSNLNDFVDAFLSDGYLIMNENQLRDAAMSEQTDVKGIWHVPATLQLFWQPVFSILNRAKALPELLYQLVVALGASPVTNVRRRQLVGWVDRMLDAFLHSQQLSELDWKRIMRRMLDCRENFTDTHLEAVAGKIVSMTNQKRQHLQQLLSMSPVVAKKSHIKRSASKDQEEGDGVASVKIVADLCTLKKMANSISEVEDETIRASDTWIRCDASSWQEVPLGLTPHQSNDTIMLVIDTETFIPRKRWCP